jgi:acyl dehydratase
VRLYSEVLESRRSASRPDRGVVRWRWDVLNQRDETVLAMIGTQMFLVRPS